MQEEEFVSAANGALTTTLLPAETTEEGLWQTAAAAQQTGPISPSHSIEEADLDVTSGVDSQELAQTLQEGLPTFQEVVQDSQYSDDPVIEAQLRAMVWIMMSWVKQPRS